MNGKNQLLSTHRVKGRTQCDEAWKPLRSWEERVCRICMDAQGEFISPCNCRGSAQYIHEECLKTWLTAKYATLEAAQCEICHEAFQMDVVVKSKCTPGLACREGLTQCLFIPLLLAVQALLVLIVVILAQKLQRNPGSVEEESYALALMVTCGASALIIFIRTRFARPAARWARNRFTIWGLALPRSSEMA